MNRLSLVILTFLLSLTRIFAQSNYAPLNEDYYHTIDRYEVKAGKIFPQIFTTIKPYKRSDIVSFVDTVKSQNLFESNADQFNYSYLASDSWEWSRTADSDSGRPVLKHFYKKKSDLFHVDTDGLDLHINPVIYWGAGKDSRLDDLLYTNTRGIEVRGMVDRKIGFYTYLTENQSVLPAYVRDQVIRDGVIPHEGFWKEYKDGQGVDFLQARGYINFNATRHVDVQFGHDRFFFGNGYRSLIYSDYAPPTFFLKGNVKVWKLNYLFLVNQMTADVNGNASGLNSLQDGYPQKFSAFHHLSLNIGSKFNLGIFESVIFSAQDTVGSNNFRAEYLNPIIFYRAIEQQNGSSDNVMLGADFKWNVVRKLSLYGQFVLDEFVIDHIRAQDGWWANKFAVQLGGKYVDAFGVSNLDLQGEINVVRPYMYSHNTMYGNYSNYRQPVAHPLGANFKEVTGILRYQPIPRVSIKGKLSYMDVGRDSLNSTSASWGGNILRRNTLRARELGNTVSQGVSNKIVFGSLTISWMWKHNLFFDASLMLRQSNSPLAEYDNNSMITSLALRWNIPQRLYDF
jgi:hypothetical protein